jgi:hypothetical protein
MAKKKAIIKPITNKIENKTQYGILMKNISGMMCKGENNSSANELSKLRMMAETAENYEDFKFPLGARI